MQSWADLGAADDGLHRENGEWKPRRARDGLGNGISGCLISEDIGRDKPLGSRRRLAVRERMSGRNGMWRWWY